jgi:hypothetical protein
MAEASRSIVGGASNRPSCSTASRRSDARPRAGELWAGSSPSIADPKASRKPASRRRDARLPAGELWAGSSPSIADPKAPRKPANRRTGPRVVPDSRVKSWVCENSWERLASHEVEPWDRYGSHERAARPVSLVSLDRGYAPRATFPSPSSRRTTSASARGWKRACAIGSLRRRNWRTGEEASTPSRPTAVGGSSSRGSRPWTATTTSSTAGGPARGSACEAEKSGSASDGELVKVFDAKPLRTADAPALWRASETDRTPVPKPLPSERPGAVAAIRPPT